MTQRAWIPTRRTTGGAPVLLSVNVGMPKDVSWHGRTVYTGVWKHAVTGPQMVRRLNIDGDGQGDTAGHGGEQRAVFVYQIDSYRYWQRHFGRDDFTYGQFGENLTVDGLPDDEVCIGDRYRIGEAEFEVTQPRVTCYRVGLRMGEPELPALLVSHHRPGFYMRVLTEGHIQAGDQIVKTRTGPHAPHRGRHRRAALPARTRPRQAPHRDPDPGAQPWLAGVVPRTRGRRGCRHRSGGEPADVDRIPAASRDQGGPRSRRRVVDLPGRSGREPVAGRPGRPVPDAADPRPGPARAGAQLLPVLRARRRRLPDQRQARAARNGERLSHRQRAPRRGPRRGGAPRRLRPRSTEPARCCSSPRASASPRCSSMLHELAARRSDREVWWIHGDRGPREQALAVEAHDLLTSLPHAHEQVFWSKATAAERDRGHAAPGRLTQGRAGRTRCSGRPRTPTSAARPRS